MQPEHDASLATKLADLISPMVVADASSYLAYEVYKANKKSGPTS